MEVKRHFLDYFEIIFKSKVKTVTKHYVDKLTALLADEYS